MSSEVCLCRTAWSIILTVGLLCICEYQLSVSSSPPFQEICGWDPKTSFSDFIACVSHQRKKRQVMTYDVADYYGHPCHIYLHLNQPRRRTSYKISAVTGDALCDRALKRRWYRFEGPAGGAVPETCVEEFSCGTHAPIWMNGQHPTLPGEVVDREVCVSLGGRCCAQRWYIRVAHCGQFYSYLLSEAPGCFMAYCAGIEEPCRPGESSPTGYSPGCSTNFPKPSGRVRLSMGQEDHRMTFYCDYEGPIPVGSILAVDWYADGDLENVAKTGHVPVFQDRMVERRRSVLTENHWMGKMGSTISCHVRAKWRNETGVPSPPIKSEKHFAGIKILKRVVNVSESEAGTQIQFQSTVPVKCLPQFKDVCGINVELAHDPEYQSKRCIDSQMRQVVFGDCNVKITPSNWRDVHNVSVKAVRDFYHDGNKYMKVNFRPIYSTLASPIWNNYKLPDVEVLARDAPNKMCMSTGDPHYSTFDGLYYHVYLEGEFVMYKNTRLPLQINARLERCGKSVTCNCGIAVMAADDVIVIDRCERRKRNLAFGKSFPDGWRTLHRHALEQGSSFVKGLKIYEYDEGRRYTVHLPTGAYIDFKVGEHWINLFLYASSDDWKSTLGLCGTFDGKKYNDFTFPDGITRTTARDHDACAGSDDVCDFANSWRVEGNDTFFDKVVGVKLNEHEFFQDTQYCKCEDNGGKKSTVVCNYHYDVDNCQSRETTRHGVDKTDHVMRRSRTKRSAELSDEAFDYFEAEFVYDKNFVGTIPTWPTPSGLVESQVRNYCIEVIMRSEVARVCNHVVQENLANIIDTCVTDIKVTDNLEWALSALSSYTSGCTNEIHTNAAYWENSKATNSDDTGYEMEPFGETLLGAVCPNSCNSKGRCTRGQCQCVYGFGGDDCAIQLLEPPKIVHLTNGGLCDIRKQGCRSMTVYGTGFRNQSQIYCHFKESARKSTNSDAILTMATFETFEEIHCPFPDHHVTLGNEIDDETATSPSVIYDFYVTQDGENSTTSRVVIFDSVCQDCAIDTDQFHCKQTIVHLTNGGLCDIRKQGCRSMTVYGTGFRNQSQIYCHFKESARKSTNSDAILTMATFETFEEIHCPFPDHHVTLGNEIDDETATSPSVIYDFYVTQDGENSTTSRVVIFDSVCQDCAIDTDQFHCKQTPTSCLIGGVCYAPDEPDPQNCCRRCIPSQANDSFVLLERSQPPRLSPAQTDYVISAGIPWRFPVGAVDPEGCDFTLKGSGPLIGEILAPDFGHVTQISNRDIALELNNATVAGTYKFSVTAEDECGHESIGVYQVVVTENIEVKTTRTPDRCLGNSPPVFKNSSILINVVHGENLNVQMKADDAEEKLLEYVAIKKSNNTMSISQRGMLTFIAPLWDEDDVIRVVATDNCDAKATLILTLRTMECPCFNGGTCHRASKPFVENVKYKCACASGFRGRLCRRKRS